MEHRPVTFAVNSGQAPEGVLFQAQGKGFQAFFERDAFVLRVLTGSGTDIHATEQRIAFVGASRGAVIEPLERQPGILNYFRGNDPARWVRKLATYARLRYRDIYPGIDLLFYDNHGTLEYDFVARPGADPSLIRLRVGGNVAAHITPTGEWQTGEGSDAVLHRPLLYQNVGSGKRTVGGSFIERADGTIGFRFDRYDARLALVIDPTLNLLYSTYLGGVHDDVSSGIALDAQGNIYIVGDSASQDYPVSGNAYQTNRQEIGTYKYTVVVTKLSPAGVLLYSTFLGGSNGNDTSGYSNILVDANGNAYFTGMAQSTNFPVTANAYLGTYPPGSYQCAFLSEIGPDGSDLVYSSYFGGPNGSAGSGLAFNAQGQLVMVGSSPPGLPATAGAYMRTLSTGNAAFVAEFDLTQTGTAQLVAATYYGANTQSVNSTLPGSIGSALALDASGNVWITGQSYTTGLPTTSNALQSILPAMSSSCQGYGAALNSAAYLAKLSSNLSSLLYGSYLSGKTAGAQVDDCAEFARSLAVDSSGNLYITGSTASSTFPVTTGVNQPTYSGAGGYYGYVGFVTKLNSTGTAILWSSYLAGNGGDTFPVQLKLDSSGNVWVAGTTAGGSNFPITQGAYQTTQEGTSNGHITEYSSDGTRLLYGSYLGGSGYDSIQALTFDALGNIYLTGDTTSTNFPVSANAYQPKFANGDVSPDHNDIFVTILGTGVAGVIAPTSGGNTGDTTIDITGSGFEAGATCALVGAITINAATVTIADNGTAMACSFSLNGVAPGSYNVVVTNPGGAPLTSQTPFTVLSGGKPSVWSNVAGRSIMRVNTPSTFYVTYGNSGTVDAFFTVLWVTFPTQLNYNSLATISPAPTGTGGVADLAITNSTTGLSYMGLLIPYIPAGGSFTLPIQFTDPNLNASLPLQVYTRAPWFDSSSDAMAALQQAISNPAGLVTTCVSPAGKPYLNNCLGDLAYSISSSVVQMTYPNQPSPLDPMPSQYVPIANSAISSLASILLTDLQGQTTSSFSRVHPLASQAGRLLPDLDAGTIGPPLEDNINTLNGTAGGNPNLTYTGCVTSKVAVGEKTAGCTSYTQYQYTYCNGTTAVIWERTEPDPNEPIGGSCVAAFLSKAVRPSQALRLFPLSDGGESCSADSSDRGGDGDGSSSGGSCSSSGGSIDPNDKNGPIGDGSASRYVRLAPLTYSVAFENQPSATLPAQQVVVTDQLDPTKVDLTMVALGSFAFGSNVISVPAGVSNYNTTFPVNSSLSVRIQGSLNADTGLLTWTFTSIDPSTGLPPSDPSVGFLPPDTDGIQGQGAVQFSVMPKSTDTTGTQITNQASVVFDANAPLQTPTWLNTIDATPPVSSVAALPATETQTTFTVSWSGSRPGIGNRVLHHLCLR